MLYVRLHHHSFSTRQNVWKYLFKKTSSSVYSERAESSAGIVLGVAEIILLWLTYTMQMVTCPSNSTKRSYCSVYNTQNNNYCLHVFHIRNFQLSDSEFLHIQLVMWEWCPILWICSYLRHHTGMKPVANRVYSLNRRGLLSQSHTWRCSHLESMTPRRIHTVTWTYSLRRASEQVRYIQ